MTVEALLDDRVLVLHARTYDRGTVIGIDGDRYIVLVSPGVKITVSSRDIIRILDRAR